MDTVNKIYYVYKWFFKDTGEIFHIGKGYKNRYKDTHNHRNGFFKNIVNKYKDNVDSAIMFDNMYEAEALALERKLIKEYKAIGWCKTNLHEGGCGGNTGNYDNPERSRKISEFAKTRVGNKNPMFGHKHTKEAKEIMSKVNIGRKLSKENLEKLKAANTGRIKTKEEIEKLRNAQKGIPKPQDQYAKMMYSLNKNYFLVYYKDQIVYATISSNKLTSFSKKYLKISVAILSKILLGNYKPKFNRNMWLSDIRIEKHIIDETVRNFLSEIEVERISISDEMKSFLNTIESSHYIKTEKYATHKNRTQTAVK